MTQIRHDENKAFKIIERFNHLNASRAPISDFLPIVDADNLIVTLRDSDIVFKGIAGLADHQIGKLSFFDQKFDCELVKSEYQKERLTMNTKGVWYATIWQSPAPYSQKLIADLVHTWILKRTEQSTYIIDTHICEYFKYRDGFSPRDFSDKDFHYTLK